MVVDELMQTLKDTQAFGIYTSLKAMRRRFSLVLRISK